MNQESKSETSPIPPIHATREEWLTEAVRLMTPLFELKDFKVPKNLAVSCGWPSKSGLSPKKRRIGECWSDENSSDKKFQIFISPWLNDILTEGGVLATLVHEVVHAVVGLEARHGKLFKKCALAVGLEGKMTQTYAGAELLEFIKEWAGRLGTYPHGKLDQMKSLTKKDTCRQLKCECAECGYTVRLSRKWMEEVGLPYCPKHGEMKAEKPLPKKEDNDDNEGGEE